MEIQKLVCRKLMADDKAEALKGKFIDTSYIKLPVINTDTDAFTSDGKLLFRFRKNILPIELLKLGYESFKDSIELTEGRGITSGYSGKRVKKDGTLSNITVGAKVKSGAIGAMDPSAMIHYCRKTGFTRKYFEKYTQGLPFVEAIDKLYSELAPDHYKIQKLYAEGTNINYRIGNTVFTTITMNESFRTACHKDSGDLPTGFGNLIVYNDGSYREGYFTMPQFGVGIELENTDVLFCDVHQWHANTEFILNEGFEKIFRISWVLYYRENMIKCASPEDELTRIKLEENGFYRL